MPSLLIGWATVAPQASNTNTTTTTTGDLRRRITSPVTAAILVTLLTAGPMDPQELLEEVERLTGRELSPQSLYRYLYYYKRKGWLAQGSPLWSLTELGEQRVCKYARTLARLLSISPSEILNSCMENEGISRVEDLRKKVETRRNTVEEFLPQSKICSTREKYLKIINELDEEEQDVLAALVEHKCKWGSNYRYFDELIEELKIPAEELLRVLRRLQSKRLVYLYEDKRKHAVRVGLGRALRE